MNELLQWKTTVFIVDCDVVSSLNCGVLFNDKEQSCQALVTVNIWHNCSMACELLSTSPLFWLKRKVWR